MIVIETEMRAGFSKYRDCWGLIQPRENPDDRASGNGLLYTAEYYHALLEAGFFEPFDELRLNEILTLCERKPGLLQRSPTWADQEGIDDYIAVVSLLGALDGKSERVRTMLEYGRANRFCYNNVNPGRWSWSAWFGRFPQLIALMEWCAGERPPLWRRIYTGLVLSWATRAKKENHDAWALAYHLALGVCDQESEHGFAAICARGFLAAFDHAWPGGMGQLRAAYFQNPEHPLAKWNI